MRIREAEEHLFQLQISKILRKYILGTFQRSWEGIFVHCLAGRQCFGIPLDCHLLCSEIAVPRSSGVQTR